MSFKKALLSSVVLASVAHGALAATIDQVSIGTGTFQDANSTYALASEYSFGTGSPVSSLTFRLAANQGFLSSGQVAMSISLSGAVFGGAVNTGNVVAATTDGVAAPGISVSTAGADGGTSAVFVVSVPASSGTDGIATGEGFRFTIPFRATGGNVAVTGAFRTESGNLPVDGPATTRTVLRTVDAYSAAAAADTVTSQLTIASAFRSFNGDQTIGRLAVVPSTVTGVFKDLVGGATAGNADVSVVSVVVTGDFSNFGTNSTTQARLQLVDSGATRDFAISGGTATVSVTSPATAYIQSAATNAASPAIRIQPGTSQSGGLAGGAYNAQVSVTYVSPPFVSTADPGSGALQTVTREGTSLLFPWTASQNIANLSGSSNIIRLGNRGSSAITGVFARVLNSSNSSFVISSALVPVGSIPANGELVLTSSTLQGFLGDFGRGDVEIVVEAGPDVLTTRRLVQRPDGVFDWAQGAGTNAN